MVIQAFPPLEYADESGLLAVGGDLDVESLLLAYRSGIFPWPLIKEGPLMWFSPPERGVLFVKDFHISRSLQKELKRNRYEFRIDNEFEKIIKFCATVRRAGRGGGTWITDEMVDGYVRLYHAGYCHSIGCFENGELVGGLYGVSIGRMFAGESMFHRRTNTSKLCVCALVEHLRQQGVEWIDCQQLTPLFESFGAREIPRTEFLEMLRKVVDADPLLFPK